MSEAKTTVRDFLMQAQRAYDLYQHALTIFIANCQRWEFDKAETERDTLHAQLDSYLDNMMAANRKAQQEQSNGKAA
jgi:hypothetical protein